MTHLLPLLLVAVSAKDDGEVSIASWRVGRGRVIAVLRPLDHPEPELWRWLLD